MTLPVKFEMGAYDFGKGKYHMPVRNRFNNLIGYKVCEYYRAFSGAGWTETPVFA